VSQQNRLIRDEKTRDTDFRFDKGMHPQRRRSDAHCEQQSHAQP